MAKQNKKGFKVNDFSWKETRTLYQRYCDDMYYQAMSERRAYGEKEITKEDYFSQNEAWLIKNYEYSIGEDNNEIL